MPVVLAFSTALVVAVLLSRLADRSVVSTTVIFLIAGVVTGPVLGVVDLAPTEPIVAEGARIALFAVLFTDGMHVRIDELRQSWDLPARALLVGLPLAVVFGALLTAVMLGEGWAEAALVGAVLAPTDPVFASAIVGRTEVPVRLRRLLNVESGLNDGLVLPLVVVLLDVSTGSELHVGSLLAEVALGAVVGIAVPVVVVALERSRLFGAHGAYEPLNAVAIGGLVFALCAMTHANEYIAAFSAGIALAARSREVAGSFASLAEPAGELIKLAAVFMFGLLLVPSLFTDLGWQGWVLVALFLFVVRPASLVLSLLGSRLDRDERLAASWFGPKGFASVTYGLLLLTAVVPNADLDFGVVAATIAASMVLHSSTDVLVARHFANRAPANGERAGRLHGAHPEPAPATS